MKRNRWKKHVRPMLCFLLAMLAKVLKLDTNAHLCHKGGAFFLLSGAGLEGVCK